MKVSIIGTGYVGLTSGAVLAYLGHEVTCLDTDRAKIAQVRAGRCPFSEPHLDALLRLAGGRCRFTTFYEEGIPSAEVILLCVGTPPAPDGSPDLRSVFEVARAIGAHLGSACKVVANKSTVPVGTAKLVQSLIRETRMAGNGKAPAVSFSVASNPEFLSQGAAVRDCLYPDRILVGADDPRGVAALRQLYEPVIEQSFAPPAFLPRPRGKTGVPLLDTDLASAELIKYAANAFLALKISFINEVAELAEKTGADVGEVARGIGFDPRIGPSFLQAGIGWGGSCFGKDTAALLATASQHGLSMPVVQAAREVNYRQRQRVLEPLHAELGGLEGQIVGLLGLAFKPHTDDVRDAPGLDLARRLIAAGATVKAHHPVALDRARAEPGLPDLIYCDTPQAVAQACDAIVLVTEWPQYRRLPWSQLAAAMRSPVLLDGRNCLDPKQLERAGFRSVGMGRRSTRSSAPRPIRTRTSPAPVWSPAPALSGVPV